MRSLLWRQAHPQTVWILLSITFLGAILTGWFWLPALAALWIVQDIGDRYHAKRQGYQARFWTPGAPRWIQIRLRTLQGPILPIGPIWELPAQDQHRWPGTPHNAARAYRRAYEAEMIHILATKPAKTTVCCTTFNHLTEKETQAIMQAGGWIGSGALDPHLPRLFRPRTMAAIQRRMFGEIISNKDRTRAQSWTTWVVPGRGT